MQRRIVCNHQGTARPVPMRVVESSEQTDQTGKEGWIAQYGLQALNSDIEKHETSFQGLLDVHERVVLEWLRDKWRSLNDTGSSYLEPFQTLDCIRFGYTDKFNSNLRKTYLDAF